MSSHAPTDPTRSPGRRIGFLAALLLIAFVVGALVMGWSMRSGRVFGRPLPAQESVQEAEAARFVPAQPLSSTGATAAVDPAMLVTREAALAAQLAALEARAAMVATDAAAAGAQATRAEALMVAFAVRRAVDRGAALGYLEEQLRTRFGQAQPRAVAVVIQAAHTPVTLEDLREGLDAIAPGLQTGSEGGWWENFRRELGDLVVLRREGTPSASSIERLERAQRLLADGRVEDARAEVALLPGAQAATGWSRAAQRYALAHRALDVIETAAILGQAQGVQPPPRLGDEASAPVTTLSEAS